MFCLAMDLSSYILSLSGSVPIRILQKLVGVMEMLKV